MGGRGIERWDISCVRTMPSPFHHLFPPVQARVEDPKSETSLQYSFGKELEKWGIRRGRRRRYPYVIPLGVENMYGVGNSTKITGL